MAALTASLLALSAVSTYAATRKQGEYESGQLDVNAGLADEQAADALTRGKEAAARTALDTKALIGSQRVALAGQGVDVNSGTAADLQSDSAQLGELDRLQIEHNAQREAYGYKVDAANSRAQGEQVRSASRNAARGTLLTAASQMYAMKPSSTSVPTRQTGYAGSV